MNPKKFAFIICTNSELFLSECVLYLNRLLVPEGYETELLTIYDAPSMTSGYNEGMRSTDAKYKIYLHQDVFLLNRYFLFDLLTLFAQDPAIGMVGMVGYPSVSTNGVMWRSPRTGISLLYGSSPRRPYAGVDPASYRYQLEDGYKDVALIDGLLMATAYDLPWEEDVLHHFDFYDAFHSMEFLLHGYRIVCPMQRLPWVIHDDGHYLSLWNYNQYRRLFLERYRPYLGLSCEEIRAQAKNGTQ